MGVRLSFTPNSTIWQQLQQRTPSNSLPRGSVYVVNCLATTCTQVYIGQTGKVIERRMSEHTRKTLFSGAVPRHNALPGHELDTENPTVIYRSDSTVIRETIEAAVIYSSPTVQNNTASASVANDDLVAPIILQSTRLIWNNVAYCIPHFKEESVPSQQRHKFGNEATITPYEPSRPPPDNPVATATRSRGPPPDIMLA